MDVRSAKPRAIGSGWRAVLISERLAVTVLTLTVATSGMERVDLSGGLLPFRLTPFVVLSPLAVIVAGILFFRGQRERVAGPRWWHRTRLATIAFVVAASISGFAAGKQPSFSRIVLLLLLVGAGWAAVSCARWLRRPDVLGRGALLALIVYVLFDAAQWVGSVVGYVRPESGLVFVDLWVHPFGNGIRLSGGLLDANRAGLHVAIMAYLVFADPWTRKLDWRPWIAKSALAATTLLAFATLSRSGLVAFALVFVAALKLMFIKLTWRRLLITSGFVAAGIAACAATIIAVAGNSPLGVMLKYRLDIFTDDSASQHFGLVGQGLQVLVSIPQAIPFGVGYGTSFLYIGDAVGATYFGNAHSENYYAMFHSAYVTALVETGIVGLVLFLVLSLAPALSSRAPLVIGLCLFGLFYQALSDPAYWLAIALTWAGWRSRANQGDRSTISSRDRPELQP